MVYTFSVLRHNKVVSLSFSTKNDLCETDGLSDFIHLYTEYHFDSNETTSRMDRDASETLVSTESSNIESVNRKFSDQLKRYSPTFVRILRRTDFEDGMNNYLSNIVENFIQANSFVTYSWLASIYSNYQKDAVVLAGLLRIIELTIRSEDIDILLPVVKAGLADSSSLVQEAAIMVIEQWRTKNCLDALETTTFKSKMVESYANDVLEELKEELHEVNA